ncbi:MAG: hypothetical protein NVV59_14585 [Chitinophagaceae bacterium]|nr:hypothetical protein [Chitinophagaceae bacterium]
MNDVQLNEVLLSELYPHALVVTGIEKNAREHQPEKVEALPETSPATTPVSVKQEVTGKPAFLGNNQQQVTIIVQYADAVHLPDEQLQFLTTMLNACKLSLGDVAIHNFNPEKNLVARDITSELKSKVVLLFGVTPDVFGLPTHFPAYQVQPLAGITYLYSPALEYYKTPDETESRTRKSQLWVCLKQIFFN